MQHGSWLEQASLHVMTKTVLVGIRTRATARLDAGDTVRDVARGLTVGFVANFR